jgi:hypothetical protein
VAVDRLDGDLHGLTWPSFDWAGVVESASGGPECNVRHSRDDCGARETKEGRAGNRQSESKLPRNGAFP